MPMTQKTLGKKYELQYNGPIYLRNTGGGAKTPVGKFVYLKSNVVINHTA